MTPADILDALRADGLVVELDGASIALDGPSNSIARWLPTLREHKVGVLAALAAESGPLAANPDAAEPGDQPDGANPMEADFDSLTTGSTSPADTRMARVINQLRGDPSLRYVIEAHDDVVLESVILSLEIRGKAACELRIPRSRYDAFALMELIEKHTMRETLQ